MPAFRVHVSGFGRVSCCASKTSVPPPWLAPAACRPPPLSAFNATRATVLAASVGRAPTDRRPSSQSDPNLRPAWAHPLQPTRRHSARRAVGARPHAPQRALFGLGSHRIARQGAAEPSERLSNSSRGGRQAARALSPKRASTLEVRRREVGEERMRYCREATGRPTSRSRFGARGRVGAKIRCGASGGCENLPSHWRGVRKSTLSRPK